WLITWLLAGPRSLLALASGQMAYHMAAALLIHYQRERLLLLCLLPGLVAGGLFLSPLSLPTAVVIAMIAVSLALSLAFALGLRPEQAAAAKSFRFVTFAELQAAIPFLFYGLLCALLVSYDSLRFRDWIGSTSFGLTIAPLVLSMGVLEWQLRVFRERVAIALARSTSVTHLGSEVWRLFVAALARFALILGALSAGAFVLIFTQGRNVEYLAATLLANWVLGCAFFVCFALISQNRVALVTWFGAVAFGLHLLDLTAKLPWTMSGATEASSYLLACLVFAMLQLSVARSVLCEIHYYRYDLH